MNLSKEYQRTYGLTGCEIRRKEKGIELSLIRQKQGNRQRHKLGFSQHPLIKSLNQSHYQWQMLIWLSLP